MRVWSKAWWFVTIAFALYFGFIFTPALVFPAFDATWYVCAVQLSILLTVPLLLLLAMWGGIELLVAKGRKRPIGAWTRIPGNTAVAGLSMLVAFLVLNRILPYQLPRGSYEALFSREVWSEPGSDFGQGQFITPRQKMLGDVVKNLPGKSRAEVEYMLGKGDDTQYFKSVGCDLLYVTGPERASFFGVDSEWLLIWFDEHGMYKRYAILAD